MVHSLVPKEGPHVTKGRILGSTPDPLNETAFWPVIQVIPRHIKVRNTLITHILALVHWPWHWTWRWTWGRGGWGGGRSWGVALPYPLVIYIRLRSLTRASVPKWAQIGSTWYPPWSKSGREFQSTSLSLDKERKSTVAHCLIWLLKIS